MVSVREGVAMPKSGDHACEDVSGKWGGSGGPVGRSRRIRPERA
jgi:hypothetical protein